MKVGLVYEKNKITINVNENDTVGDIKLFLREHLCLNMRAPGENEDLILHIKYAGSYLNDGWILADIGITPGSTLQCIVQSQDKIFLRAYSIFNNKYYDFTTPINVGKTTVGVLKGMIQDASGIPVSMFKLCKKASEHELYDGPLLSEYDISTGDTVYLDIWDGMRDFLVSVFAGEVTDTSDLIASIYEDPMMHRYQLRVALFVAAFLGNIQLAAQLLKSGARCNDPVGEHPARDWCKAVDTHPSSLRTPAHAAAQCGRVSCLRLFIHHNRACILSKDGNGHTPLAVARRYGQKEAFKLLVTEQFRTVQYAGLNLSIYGKVRKWCDRAKDRAAYYRIESGRSMLLASSSKSGLDANVGSLIQLNGFGENIQTSASKLNRRKLAPKNQWLWPKRHQLAGLSIDFKDNKTTAPAALRRQGSFTKKRLAKRVSSLGIGARTLNTRKEPLDDIKEDGKNQLRSKLGEFEKSKAIQAEASTQIPLTRLQPIHKTRNTESCSCGINSNSINVIAKEGNDLPKILPREKKTVRSETAEGFFVTQGLAESNAKKFNVHNDVHIARSHSKSAMHDGFKPIQSPDGKKPAGTGNRPSVSSAISVHHPDLLLTKEAHSAIKRATGQSSEQLARTSLELGDSFSKLGWLKRLQLATNYNRKTLLRGIGNERLKLNQISH